MTVIRGRVRTRVVTRPGDGSEIRHDGIMRAAGFCAAVPFWQERRNAKTVSAESTWTDPPVVVDELILAARQGNLSGEGIPARRAALATVIRELYPRWRFIRRRVPEGARG